MARKGLFVAWLVAGVALLAGLSSLILWYPPALASAATGGVLASPVMDPAVGLGAQTGIDPSVLRWGYLAAALVTAVSSLGAAYAVAAVGTAAVGLLAEKPELFGRAIILVGLAEGIAIYGLIISVLILNRLG